MSKRPENVQEECVTAGCEGKNCEGEKQDIMKQLDFISRQLPFLINLLAQIDAQKAEEVNSTLINILQENQKILH